MRRTDAVHSASVRNRLEPDACTVNSVSIKTSVAARATILSNGLREDFARGFLLSAAAGAAIFSGSMSCGFFSQNRL